MIVVSPGPVLRHFGKVGVVFLLGISLVHKNIDNISGKTHHQYREGSGYLNERISLENDRNKSKMKFNSTKYKVSHLGTNNTNTLLWGESSSVRNHQEENDLNSLVDHSMTVSCQYTVTGKKKKCVSEIQYRDISRKDRKTLVVPWKTLIKPNHEDCVHSTWKMNCYWKQHREALVILFSTWISKRHQNNLACST